MKKQFHIVLFFVVFSYCMNGVSQLSGDHSIILDASKKEIDLNSFIKNLQDPVVNPTPEDILAGKWNEKFSRERKYFPGFGLEQKTFWHSFTISNKDAEHKNWLLMADHASIDSMILYSRDSSGNFRSLLASKFISPEDKKYKFNSLILELPVSDKSDNEFYLKIDSRVYNYPLKLVNHERFISLSLQRNIIQGMFIGFFIMMLLYNLFIFFIERDRSFLYYVIYVLLNGLMICIYKSYLDPFLPFDPRHSLNYLNVMLSLNNLALILFSGNILDLSKNPGFLGKILNYLFIPISALSLALFQMQQQNILIMANLWILFALLLYFSYSAFRVYKNDFRPAAFYLSGSIAFLVGLLWYATSLYGIIPNNFSSNYLLEIGAAAQVMLFSFALGDKIREYKRLKYEMEKNLLESLKQNEQIILEQNRILEISATERTKELKLQKEKSDKLLLNILPEDVATELKESGVYEAKLHPNISVLYTDFVNFTKISEHLSPKDLVEKLHIHFKAFDEITDRNGLEKIRTIGDAYLAVCGLQEESDHAKRAVKAAIEIRNYLLKQNSTGDEFEIRIGIHSGPVVAGIVGVKKFTYDIWGETVNMASKLENLSQPGKINISNTTSQLLNNEFQCTLQGRMSTKSDMELDYYHVEYN